MLNEQKMQSWMSHLEVSIQNELWQYLESEKIPEKSQQESCLVYLTSRSHLYPEYDRVAVQIAMDSHRERTLDSFVKTIQRIQENRDLSGEWKPLLHPEFYQFIQQNAEAIEHTFEKCLREESTNSFPMTYFGWKTLYKTYFLRTHQGVQERLEHLFFRVALFLYRHQLEKVQSAFGILYRGEAIHATPTLYHAGLLHSQMASCFLVGTQDSVSGIFKTVSDVAMISKYAGGIGIHISNVRGENSYIHGTNGKSNGIMPMLRVYNATARYIDQCFEGNVPVLTQRGWIPISDIQIHLDSVLSSDGKFHRVVNKLIHHGQYTMMEASVDRKRHTWWPSSSFRCTLSHDLLFLREGELVYESCEKATLDMKTLWMDVQSVYYDDLSSFSHEHLWTLGFLYRNLQGGILPHEGHLWNVDTALNPYLETFFNHYCYGQWTRHENHWMIKWFSTDKKLDWDRMIEHQIPASLLFGQPIESFYQGFCCTSSQKETETIQWQIRTMEYRLQFPKNEWRLPSDMIFRNSPSPFVGNVYDLEIEDCPSYQTMMGMAHNGGGKRKGAFAMYMEPWHMDIMNFVMARRPVGNEEERARDLFYGLWIPDRFMEMVEQDGPWYLMGKEEAQTLVQVWGSEFNRLYDHYIQTKKYVQKIQARDLWLEILKSQMESGTPYLLYKDTCNRLSNQKNVGTIRSSNLCCEIIEYSDEKEYAVCNLASISLKSCLEFEHERVQYLRQQSIQIYGKQSCSYCELLCLQLQKYKIAYVYRESPPPIPLCPLTYPCVFINDEYVGGFTELWRLYLQPCIHYDRLKRIVQQLVENLNVVIDKNDYPLEECRQSNLKHRPIGIGVQGLADVFMEMLEPYDSPKSRQVNRSLFEHIYFYALEKSMELAKVHGSYKSFLGSPLSNGQFHFDLWGLDYDQLQIPLSQWEQLRHDIQIYGVRNSLLIAPMPTASTSQILGNTESFEPLTSNLYLRRTNAGEFYVVNSILHDLLSRWNKWDETLIQKLILDKGSLQSCDMLPSLLRNVFRTVWEISTKHLIEMASDRQAFIDQSQSFNIYLAQSDLMLLNKIHFYGWKKQLKTGCYYLRTRAPVSSQSFTIDPVVETEHCESCTS